MGGGVIGGSIRGIRFFCGDCAKEVTKGGGNWRTKNGAEE